MSAHNPFKLGEAFGPDTDAATEYRLKRNDQGTRWPRRFEEYWNVIDKNLNTVSGAEALEKRIFEAYGCDDHIYLDPRWFVTDSVELFCEMYRLLRIDFVADFRTGLFFMDVFAGHEVLMTDLFELSKQKVPKACGADLAEAYVVTGLGMFRSSQSPVVRLGEDVAIPDYFRPWKHNVERW